MADPAILSAGYSKETAATTTHDVVVPSGIAAGNLLLLCLCFTAAQGSDPTVTGWTKVFGTAGVTTNYVYYKIASGSEADFTYTTSSVAISATRCLRISPWHGTSAPEASANATGTSSHPDTATITPSWGSANSMFISWVNWIDTVDSLSAYPANYTLGQFTEYPWLTNRGLAVSARVVTGATEDPPAYALTSIANSWQGVTIAIRPEISIVVVTKDVTSAGAIATTNAREAASAARLSRTELASIPSAATIITVNTRSAAMAAALSRMELKDADSAASISQAADALNIASAAAISALLSKDASTVAGIGFTVTKDVTSAAGIIIVGERNVASAAALLIQIQGTRNVTTSARISAQGTRNVATGAAIGITIPTKKVVHFHIFTSAGVVIRTWNDVSSLPNFSRVINDGPTAMKVTLARSLGATGIPGEAGSLGDVRNGNLVQVWIVDRESGSEGRLIYKGKIRQHRTLYPHGSMDLTIVAKKLQLPSQVDK